MKSGIGVFTFDLKYHRREAAWVYDVESEGLVIGSPARGEISNCQVAFNDG